ncbi:MAG: VWA domain-containing protein [Acidobacteriota bacterium]
MRLFSIPILFLALIFVAVSVPAQSGNGGTPTGGKANKRPAATPTPVPAIVDPIASNDQAGPVDDADVIKVSTQLVSVPVRVMDKKGRFVAGLTKDNFSVFEDGVKQDVQMFSNEHEPFTVALVLDMSYSTKFKIAEIQSAAIAFIDQLRPKDKVMVVSFDGDVHLLCEATTDRQAINSAIRSTKIATGTSLYEAIDLVINDRMRKVEGRKAIILFTDGVDTTSQKVSDYNNLSDALELDSLIYPIRYDTYGDVQEMLNKPAGQAPPIKIPGSDSGSLPGILGTLSTVGPPSTKGTTAEDYRRAEEYLEQLALRTGGREYVADSLTHLSEAFSRIASELREFYSIGYYPTAERVTGRKASVKVKVDQPGLAVRARDGFLMRKGAKKRT